MNNKNSIIAQKFEELLREQYGNNILLYYYYSFMDKFHVAPSSFRDIIEWKGYVTISDKIKELYIAISKSKEEKEK